MLRKPFYYAILVAAVLWLLLSYLPASVVTMPTFAAPPPSIRSMFQMGLTVSVVAFLLLQIWLLRLTQRMFRVPADDAESSPDLFGLNLATELFWTAVPIAMTLGLALLSYRTWRALVN